MGLPSQALLYPLSPALHSAPNQEVDAAEIQVQVCLYAFDLIYLNGEVGSGSASGGVAGRGRAVIGRFVSLGADTEFHF